RQARRAGVGADPAAGRGEGRRVRLPHHLARRQENHLRAGFVVAALAAGFRIASASASACGMTVIGHDDERVCAITLLNSQKPEPPTCPRAKLERSAANGCCTALAPAIGDGRLGRGGWGCEAQMANVVVMGAQWGDEGKGKIVDWLS